MRVAPRDVTGQAPDESPACAALSAVNPITATVVAATMISTMSGSLEQARYHTRK